jgi:hypothetical protein
MLQWPACQLCRTYDNGNARTRAAAAYPCYNTCSPCTVWCGCTALLNTYANCRACACICCKGQGPHCHSEAFWGCDNGCVVGASWLDVGQGAGNVLGPCQHAHGNCTDVTQYSGSAVAVQVQRSKGDKGEQAAQGHWQYRLRQVATYLAGTV